MKHDMYELPESLYEFAQISDFHGVIEDLATMAEDEDWNYHNTTSTSNLPILENYIRNTYINTANSRRVNSAGVCCVMWVHCHKQRWLLTAITFPYIRKFLNLSLCIYPKKGCSSTVLEHENADYTAFSSQHHLPSRSASFPFTSLASPCKISERFFRCTINSRISSLAARYSAYAAFFSPSSRAYCTLRLLTEGSF